MAKRKKRKWKETGGKPKGVREPAAAKKGEQVSKPKGGQAGLAKAKAETLLKKAIELESKAGRPLTAQAGHGTAFGCLTRVVVFVPCVTPADRTRPQGGRSVGALDERLPAA